MTFALGPSAGWALYLGMGMVATVNPCGFAMLPAYLSYFLGVEGRADESARAGFGEALRVTAAVAGGFLAVFAVAATIVEAVGGAVVYENMPWVSIVIGVTLAASIASTATFVINPGFVFAHGISALMHLGVAAGLGIVTGLVVLSVGFRRIGEKTAAITLPQWIGQRYGSKALAVFFAALNLLSITFIVLIVGGISIVMQQVMGLTNLEAVALTIVFVFSYIFVGGTYAHAYTNTLQGAIMAAVTVVILASGLSFFGDGFFAKIGSADPNLLRIVNPASALFNDFFSVFVCGFVIGFALGTACGLLNGYLVTLLRRGDVLQHQHHVGCARLDGGVVALFNLVLNAVHASPTEGAVRIIAARDAAARGDRRRGRRFPPPRPSRCSAARSAGRDSSSR